VKGDPTIRDHFQKIGSFFGSAGKWGAAAAGTSRRGGRYASKYDRQACMFGAYTREQNQLSTFSAWLFTAGQLASFVAQGCPFNAPVSLICRQEPSWRKIHRLRLVFG
jgi:hypothetical protein